MEVTVISREMIKPSAPTPPHLKRLKLSLIDQHIPSTIYGRILLLYSAGGDASRFHNTNMSSRMKKSLSEVLTHFYPLAGTANKNNQWIDCDDSGLEYIEGRVKAPCTLHRLLSRPHAEDLDKLVPHDAYAYETGFRGLSAVQVTVFEGCGGMAVGVCLSHILTDASSLGVFINSWACIARGGEIQIPKFEFASIFPPRDIPAPQLGDLDTCKKLAVRMFAFPQTKIDALKARFKHQHPTKVEVLWALIFKCFVKVANKSKSSEAISSEITMNLRGRMNPPMPMHYVGNMIFPVKMDQPTPELMSLNDLGMRIRELIRKADGDYMKKLQANDVWSLMEWDYDEFADKRVFQVSSWCRFPFYKADLGWGGPAWVAPVHTKDQDCCVLIDAKNGGVEAWVILDEEDMAQFESDEELLEFTCRCVDSDTENSNDQHSNQQLQNTPMQVKVRSKI